MEATVLFRSQNLDTLKNQRGNLINRKVEEVPEDVLLSTPTQDLLDVILAEHSFQMIVLGEPSQKVSDIECDVSGDLRYRGEYMPGKRCTLTFRCEGDEALFHVRLNRFTQRQPRGHVGSAAVTLMVDIQGSDSDMMESEVKSAIQNLRQYLDWLADDVCAANDDLKRWAANAIEQRKNRILANRELEEYLAFPIEARSGVESCVVPMNRTTLASVSNVVQPFAPHPAVSQSDYHHIIKVISGMGIMMERAYRSFSSMQEEDLRHVFLAALNTHFVEQATGETFNSDGKTDILIKHENKGILFVAECKNWKGPKSLCNAVDQVLGYLTWRESKAAIILFNRERNTFEVVAKVPAVLESHPQYKRTIETVSSRESSFSCVLRHPDDSNVEIILTVLVFDLPKEGRK